MSSTARRAARGRIEAPFVHGGFRRPVAALSGEERAAVATSRGCWGTGLTASARPGALRGGVASRRAGAAAEY